MTRPAVGVIGLGIMGSAMSANLAKAGFAVHGYDIVSSLRSALKNAGGHPAGSAGEVAEKAEIVISSLPSAEALHSVASELTARCIVIETSTLPLEDKNRAFKTLEAKGIALLDCPLSGTGAQARNKDLTVYASGDQAAFEKTTPVGMKAGLDPETIYKVAGDGAGASRMFQVRGPQMVAGRYDDATMKVEVWQKDMKIIGEYATKLGVPTPLFAASAPIYTAAMAQGFSREDTAAVCAVLEAMAGLKR